MPYLISVRVAPPLVTSFEEMVERYRKFASEAMFDGMWIISSMKELVLSSESTKPQLVCGLRHVTNATENDYRELKRIGIRSAALFHPWNSKHVVGDKLSGLGKMFVRACSASGIAVDVADTSMSVINNTLDFVRVEQLDAALLMSDVRFLKLDDPTVQVTLSRMADTGGFFQVARRDGQSVESYMERINALTNLVGYQNIGIGTYATATPQAIDTSVKALIHELLAARVCERRIGDLADSSFRTYLYNRVMH